MKDALGHGSDAKGMHSAGVNQIGKTQPFVGQSYAGKFKIAAKPVDQMTNGQLEKEYEGLSVHDSAINKQFIDEGHGQSSPDDLRKSGHPLVPSYEAVRGRMNALSGEHKFRREMGGRRVQTEYGSKFVGKAPNSMFLPYKGYTK